MSTSGGDVGGAGPRHELDPEGSIYTETAMDLVGLACPGQVAPGATTTPAANLVFCDVQLGHVMVSASGRERISCKRMAASPNVPGITLLIG
jgi:hypothetical protein